MKNRRKWLMGCLGTPLFLTLFLIYILPNVVPKRKINIFHHEYELPLTITKLRQHYDVKFYRDWGYSFSNNIDSIEYTINYFGPIASGDWYESDSSNYSGYEERTIDMVLIKPLKKMSYKTVLDKALGLSIPPDNQMLWRERKFKYHYPNGIGLIGELDVNAYRVFLPDNVFFPKSIGQIFQEWLNPDLFW